MIFEYLAELIGLLDAARYVFMSHSFVSKFKVGDNITVRGWGSVTIWSTFNYDKTARREESLSEFIHVPQGMHCIVLETKKHAGEHYVRVLTPKGVGWASEHYFEKRI